MSEIDRSLLTSVATKFMVHGLFSVSFAELPFASNAIPIFVVGNLVIGDFLRKQGGEIRRGATRRGKR